MTKSIMRRMSGHYVRRLISKRARDESKRRMTVVSKRDDKDEKEG
jgi:hypothetical protein